MGLFDRLIGNASEVNLEKLQGEVGELLITNETIQNAYKIIRDIFIFTNKRLILIDKQGVTGKKIEYHSIPYKNILHFSVETAGTFDVDAELKIWISGSPQPLQRSFNKSTNIYKVQSVLAEYVLG
ncbi:PH domain-containing protein [Lysinibacillus sp. FSL K6-0232]|uniref:PH domain-containing protein n=1 Tax=Lysinibacillus sp. FSL K6-0232 TaxID=2921425 RepID=UPI0030F62696